MKQYGKLSYISKYYLFILNDNSKNFLNIRAIRVGYFIYNKLKISNNYTISLYF